MVVVIASDATGGAIINPGSRATSRRNARPVSLAGARTSTGEKRSSPDNIVVMPDGLVIIGEDSTEAGHDPPNTIWVYNPDDDRGRGSGSDQGRGTG
ncbi:hypothetical protein BRC80_04355 [Halobacteriales archaeon QH_9_66_26]|nr:MAG: hypothetical protein BRC80_04355 [Halobacteriales archaeon QH_9_66_26]